MVIMYVMIRVRKRVQIDLGGNVALAAAMHGNSHSTSF